MSVRTQSQNIHLRTQESLTTTYLKNFLLLLLKTSSVRCSLAEVDTTLLKQYRSTEGYGRVSLRNVARRNKSSTPG